MTDFTKRDERLVVLPRPSYGLKSFAFTRDIMRTAPNAAEALRAGEPATWELPPCIGCGGECVFSDGFCQPCWMRYTEQG